MTIILLSLLILPHLALAVAWVLWARARRTASQNASTWRTRFFLSGLVAASLNIMIFWSYLLWLHFHQADPSWWKARDLFEDIADFLVGYAFVTAIFGSGRGRVFLAIAAATGYLLWVTGHIGVL
jgi:hypothetical protein